MTPAPNPRQTILRCIEEHPGLHLRALERLLPYSLGALRHHLTHLEEVGLIRVEYDLRFKRYYPQAMGTDLRETCAALRGRNMRRILVLLLSNPGVTSPQIASNLGLARSSLGLYLRRLRQKGLIVKGAPLDSAWTLANPKTVEAALVTFKASFMDRVVDGALEVFDASSPPDPAGPVLPPRPPPHDPASVEPDPSEE